jgi:hypothetical protein
MRESATIRVPQFPGTRDRDRDKLFVLTEWSAARAEDWGLRMMFALGTGGGQVPLSMAGIGMEGIAILGINTFLQSNAGAAGETLPGRVIPLLNELLECVAIIRDHSKPDVVTPLLEDDIEEIATRMWLRGEVLSLHLGFSVSAVFVALYRKIMMSPTPAQPDSPIPQTSASE